MRHVAAAMLLFAIAAPTAAAALPRYESANLMQVEAGSITGVGSNHFTVTVASCKPHGAPQFRAGQSLYSAWRCHLVTSKGDLDYNVSLTKNDARCRSLLHFCSWWTQILAPWQPPAGFTLWTGYGTGKNVVAYQPASCMTIGGSQIANGATDPQGNICWAYTLVSQKDCEADIYARVDINQNGVVVGYSNDLEHVAAGQQVLMHGVVSGHPGATLTLDEVDCT
jgi:hypothetical protein